MLLRGVPIPLAATFRQLGVDIAIGGSRLTGLVVSRHLEAGRSALRRLPHLSTYDRRERAISTLVTPPALHGVVVALATEPNLRGLETAVVRALEQRACPGPRRSSSTSFPRGTTSPRSCTRSMSASSCWPAWPGGRGSPRSSPRLSRNREAAHPGRARWGARSARRPPWARPRARAGRTGTSQGKSTPCTSCRSPSANSDTGSETAFATTPRASLRRGARSPSGDWATRRTARPVARRCRRPPPSWRSRYCAASRPGPCGRWPECRATACGPTPRALAAARHTRTKPTSCGIARSGTMPGGRGAPGLATRRRQFPTWDRRTNGHRAYGRRASFPSDWRKGWTGDSSTSLCTAFTACT